MLAGGAAREHLRDVLDHVMRMWDMLESEREVINGLMDSHMIQISNRMNEIMKVLTQISTIMLPLTFIAGMTALIATVVLKGDPTVKTGDTAPQTVTVKR